MSLWNYQGDRSIYGFKTDLWNQSVSNSLTNPQRGRYTNPPNGFTCGIQNKYNQRIISQWSYVNCIWPHVNIMLSDYHIII